MNELPDSYFIAAGLCALLLVVALMNARKPWALPFGVVAATVGAWYLVEPFYFPELFAQFKFESVQGAFDSVSIFCAALLVMTPFISARMQRQGPTSNLSMSYIPADRVAVIVMCLWLALLAFGTYRMRGDIIGMLFPIDGRAGARVWSRAAGSGAGATGFIVSVASYVYVLCLASFGVLFFLVKKRSTVILLIILLLVSWPYAFLQGSRNIALATVAPAGLSFLLFSRVSRSVKFLVTVGGLILLDLVMRMIIAYRNIGFADVDLSIVRGTSHLGLNMASELVYITAFLNDGTLSLSYGARYLAELANVVPRVIWPDKPLVGIDYALARGFGDYSGIGDIGVFATISSGMIGQGVLNFGNIFGPIAVALLMSWWISLLARFRTQGTPLRLALFLVGLGLTFNLGRDITLLVLWPMIFGYVGVRLFEYFESRRNRRLAVARRWAR